jgi:cytochrome c oxidase subunit 2
VLANELHLPVGGVVDLTLTTADVIHSFWVPALAGKVDMIPGHRNRLVMHPSREGIYRGQCAEYCGDQHARMALEVVVQSPQAFGAWLAREATPAAEPATGEQARGRAAFFRGGCATCHTIRGTSAAGQLAPDLTHVGSRRMIAAGTLRNHRAALAGWIAGSQAIKPGNLMPSMAVFEGDELLALASYLESLK